MPPSFALWPPAIGQSDKCQVQLSFDHSSPHASIFISRKLSRSSCSTIDSHPRTTNVHRSISRSLLFPSTISQCHKPQTLIQTPAIFRRRLQINRHLLLRCRGMTMPNQPRAQPSSSPILPRAQESHIRILLALAQLFHLAHFRQRRHFQ